ncbi:MAG: hypothetical protein KME13_04385 [Myxacorys californica WJT36-NPBG1]|jgi:predicted  nucleic acid-binding Zn-ribbon protein|nr:hypothetical protein [Myxacorys californica WJT36-NPBG1]
MSDVVQWLNEIQDLKRQLQAAQQSQEAANASADNWRKRYEIEAQQRRQEVESMQQTLDQLQFASSQESAQQDLHQPISDAAIVSSEIEQRVEQMNTIAELKAQLIQVWSERDRLAQELETEKAQHIQTRQNLSMALGDAVDMLTKLKSQD